MPTLKKEGLKKWISAGHQWLVPIIIATWEAEIGRIMIQGESGQIAQETPSPK
jgi:hypothetical protein